MPVHVLQRERRLQRAERELAGKLGRSPTEDEVAKAAKVSAKQAREVREAARVLTSLDKPVGEEETTLGELVQSDTPEPQEIVSVSLREDAVRRAVADLPDREREVLKRRYGLNGSRDPKSIEEIVRELGMSREQVRQVESEALKRLARMREIESLREAA